MSPRRPIADSSGFTLLEVLIALAIMTIAALSLSAAFPQMNERAQLRSTGAKVDELLTLARSEAIRLQRATSVELLVDARRIGIPGLNIWRSFPDHARVSLVGAANGFVAQSPMIIFLGDGSSTGGTIEVRLGSAVLARRVNWLTGRIVDGEQ